MPDHFDIIAGVYEQAIKLKSIENWVRLANLPQTGVLLDIGGGTGRVSRGLKPYLNDVVCCDLSFGMLRQGISSANLNQVQVESENLSFPSDSFELVIMVDAFHHIINRDQTAREIWRVTKPGGRIIIEEPDIRHPLIWLVAIAEKMALMRSHFVSPPGIRRMFNYSNSRSAIFRQGYSSWIVVDKLIT